ncbi:MAG: RNA polymerase factor sigma-54 [Firmicutes bacterium]|nr:RNA polymerase factor sigma-54 [Bacillota bacterium]
MKNTFELKIEQTQKLQMTPRLLQAIKILQFNSRELIEHIQEELLSNPVLEIKDRFAEGSRAVSVGKEDGIDWMEYASRKKNDDISYQRWETVRANAENNYENYTSGYTSLAEYLMFQLQFAPLSEPEKKTGRFIIETLDSDGYTTETTEEMAKAASVSTDDIEKILDRIQRLDPPGVGSRDLRECLTVQLDERGFLDDDFSMIMDGYFKEIAGNRLNHISRETGIGTGRLQEMRDILKTLDPKPGRQFETGEAVQYIIPDISVKKADDGMWRCIMNEENTPELKLSSYYTDLIKEYDSDSELQDYLSNKINSAQWLIKNIEQRKQTISNVAGAIVSRQQDFFEAGETALKPMTLEQIAEDAGIHRSTVSRTIRGKYLECDRGTFPLKYFFSAALNMVDGDEQASATGVKSKIRRLIENEDAKKPLSDQKIADLLTTGGISVSRRTVAKYRDQMGIPSSSVRKRY